jgi:hypothetical protein
MLKLEIGKLVDRAWDKLLNIEKGDWGECIVEACLFCLGLSKSKDFKEYPRSTKKGQVYPEFSNKEFVIEVKNLSRTTEVTPKWIKCNVLPRFPEYYPTRILIIFGGKIYRKVRGLLKKEKVIFIWYKEPILRKNFRIVIWWLKDKLLEISAIRRKVILVGSRDWKPPIFTTLITNKKKPFIKVCYNSKDGTFTIESFSRTSQRTDKWKERWKKVCDMLRKEKVKWINWKKMDELKNRFDETPLRLLFS